VKKVRKAIAAGDKTAATSQLKASQAVIDRITDKKIIHKNKASRHKSRLARQVKALAGSSSA
jgi:small subunit ribosomal protein S20